MPVRPPSYPRAARHATRLAWTHTASRVPRRARSAYVAAARMLAACAIAVIGAAPNAPLGAQRPATAAPGATAATPGERADRAALVRSIEGFAFDKVMRLGVGGFMGMRVVPVVLFKDGTALTDVEGLAFPGGVAAHRQRDPDDWTTWRRAGDAIELFRRGKRSSEWKTLPFRTVYRTLPADFRLDGTYRSIGGAGNVAMGGSDMVAGWRDLRFARDGRFERGGGSGGSVSGGGASTVFSSTAATRTGRYAIDGLELVLRYDDGTVERRIIVTDPDAPTALWLDGAPYTQPRDRERRRP